jgi:dTDP-4-dehydrorhamnose 3,5-epimerase
MEKVELDIKGAYVFVSQVHQDERGSFREWFSAESVRNLTGRDFLTAQANLSISSKGTLRGIHYSLASQGQAKWITCASGAIKDVIVDIRPGSSTFGKWIEVELRSGSGKAVFIGEGLGHAFLALEDNTTVVYLLSSPFSPTDEFEINPLDRDIQIDWDMGEDKLKISEKDRAAPSLAERFSEGNLPK